MQCSIIGLSEEIIGSIREHRLPPDKNSPTERRDIMDILGFFTTAWDAIVNFFMNTLGLAGVIDMIKNLF